MSTCFLGTGGRIYGSDWTLLVRLICPLSGPTEHTPMTMYTSKTELVVDRIYNIALFTILNTIPIVCNLCVYVMIKSKILCLRSHYNCTHAFMLHAALGGTVKQ